MRRWLVRRVGGVTMPIRLGLGALAVAAIAGGAAWSAVHAVAPSSTVVAAAIAIPIYGAIYLGVMARAGVPEARAFTRRVPGLGRRRDRDANVRK